jgi:SPP1 gp7 family putative phage head morphogenesis protein
VSGLGLRITLAEVRLLAQAADAIERLKADAAEFAEEMAERTGVAEFLDVGGLAFDVEPERALAYFRGKGLRPSFSYADMIGAVNDQAFTVAKMMDVDLLGQVRDSLTAALAEGQQFREWKATIQPTLESAGWWGTRSMVDPLTGRTVQAQLGSAWRLETIFRTNMQTAYAAQAWTEIEAQADIAPYLIYDAVDDLRTREAHRRWDRTTLPVDSPWWRTHYPPNGWNCRCGVIQVSEDELRELGIRPTAPPDDGAYKWTNPRTGQVIKVPDGIDPGFDRNPGQDAGAGVRRALDEKVQKLPRASRRAAKAATRRDFDAQHEAGRWHAESFDGAPEWVRNRALDDQFVNVQAIDPDGAWARGGQLVDMDQRTKDNRRGRNTWRHEFGHIMDWRLGTQQQAPRVYASTMPEFVTAMEADADYWMQAVRATAYSRGTRRAKLIEAAYTDAEARMRVTGQGDRTDELRKMAKRAGLDLDKLLGLLEETTPVVSALGGRGAVEQVGFASRVAKLIEAVRLRDGEGFVRMATFLDNYKDAQARGDSIAAGNWGQIVGQAWDMDGALASLSDLVGASTLNRAAGHQNGYAGHSDQYYSERPGFGANIEAFANLTALAGHPNSYWWTITRKLAPNMAAAFRKIIEPKP